MTTLAPSTPAPERAPAPIRATAILDYIQGHGPAPRPGLPADPTGLLDTLTPTDRARVEKFAVALPDAPVRVGGCRCGLGRRFQPRNA